MQENFYREHPDFKDSKTKTGLGWKIRMIKELTGMLLDIRSEDQMTNTGIWSNRVDQRYDIVPLVHLRRISTLT